MTTEVDSVDGKRGLGKGEKEGKGDKGGLEGGGLGEGGMGAAPTIAAPTTSRASAT